MSERSKPPPPPPPRHETWLFSEQSESYFTTPYNNSNPSMASPGSQSVRKTLTSSSLLIGGTMEEDDEEDVLYTEVVLSDDEMANYLEVDEDENDVAYGAGGISNADPPPASPLVMRQKSAPSSPQFTKHSRAVNRSKRSTSLDGVEEVIMNSVTASNNHTAAGTDVTDEEDFRIRHLLNYHDTTAGGSIYIPPAASKFQSTGAAAGAAASDDFPAVPFQTSMSSPTPTSRIRNNQEDALLVDDKPWRTHRPPPQNGFRNRNYNATQHQQKSSGTLLGYLRNRLPGKRGWMDDNSDEDGVDADDTETEDDHLVQVPNLLLQASSHHNRRASFVLSDGDKNDEPEEDHDLVVEAVSQPSSDGSSFGDNESSQDDSWEHDFLETEEDDKDMNYAFERPVEWKLMAEYQLPTHFCRPSSGTGLMYPRRTASSDEMAIEAASTGASFTHSRGNQFVWQHGMLLHAAMQLLVERDHLGIEGSMDAVDNIWKKGPLKKMTTGKGPGKWKVKYVEVRRGNLCYYEDTGLESGRKSIHLRSIDTMLIERTNTSGNDRNNSINHHHHHAQHNNSNNNNKQYMFEIVQTGSPKCLWMARSDEDRQAWMRTIQAAMIGNDDQDDPGSHNNQSIHSSLLERHQSAIDRYQALQAKLKLIDVHEDYAAAVQSLGNGRLLQIPVTWIRQQVQDLGGNRASSNHNVSGKQHIRRNSHNNNHTHNHLHNINHHAVSAGDLIKGGDGGGSGVVVGKNGINNNGGGSGAPSSSNHLRTGSDNRFKPRLTSSSDPQKQIRASITDFWNNMKETAFAVNGLAIPRDMPYCAERIFGSLTRCILEFDHAFCQESEVDNCQNGDPTPVMITDLQAVSYARDILVTVLRTREQQDVLYAVNDLLRNDDLVVLSTKEDHDIVHLEVSFAGEEWQDINMHEPEMTGNEMTIWLFTKRKNSPGWRRRFVVLSGVVLSFYESDSPRPHGLRAQVVLNRTSMVTPLENNHSYYSSSKQLPTNGGGSGGDRKGGENGKENERHALVVSTKNEARYMSFESEQDMVEWKESIQSAIFSCDDTIPERMTKEARTKSTEGMEQEISTLENQQQHAAATGKTPQRQNKFRPRPWNKVFRNRRQQQQQQQQQQAQEKAGPFLSTASAVEEEEPPTTAPQMQRDEDKTELDAAAEKEEQPVAAAAAAAAIPSRPSMSMLMDNLVERSQGGVGRREPTVQCVAQHLHRFAIKDRYSNECMFHVNAKLFQAFMLSGGSNGRLSRGNALVEIDIANEKDAPSNKGLLSEEDDKFGRMMLFV